MQGSRSRDLQNSKARLGSRRRSDPQRAARGAGRRVGQRRRREPAQCWMRVSTARRAVCPPCRATQVCDVQRAETCIENLQVSGPARPLPVPPSLHSRKRGTPRRRPRRPASRRRREPRWWRNSGALGSSYGHLHPLALSYLMPQPSLPGVCSGNEIAAVRRPRPAVPARERRPRNVAAPVAGLSALRHPESGPDAGSAEGSSA